MMLSTKDRKPREKPKRNSKAEKYNTWNETFTTGFNSRYEQAEQRIHKLKDRTIEPNKS